MTQRTCNIIMCCKGNDKFGYLSDPMISIKRYMAHECCCDERFYTDQVLDNILFEALCDYINGAKNPGFVLWSIREDGKWYDDLYEKIIAMFSLVQVREGSDHHCINGFTEDLLAQSTIDLNWN
jgi:hypothetical protein